MMRPESGRSDMSSNGYGDKQNQVLNHLQIFHKGRKKAVTSRTLEAVFNIKGSELRKIINEIRSSGHPVCSDNTGYYYAKNKKELNATIAQLSSRVQNIANARDGLVIALNK